MKNPSKISMMGLGKLGSCYAAFCAEKGFEVIGYDVDSTKVDAVNKKKAPVVEPHLQEIIDSYPTLLSATNDPHELVKETDVTFLVVPTPSNDDGSFSVQYVQAAMQSLGEALRTKESYHLFVLVSTVLPGDSRNKIIPAIEKASGKKCGVDFGYCYSPSLIAIGNIVNNLRKPDFLFLGASDTNAEKKLKVIFEKLYGKAYAEEKVCNMSIESAEVAKISLNSYVTMKITFANTLGRVCEKIPYANVDDVTNAIGKDSRIGSRFFRSGLGYGGPCFPRDNFAFASMAEDRGVDAPLARQTHALNAHMPKYIAKTIQEEMKKNGMGEKTVVGVLSLGYKTGTPFAEESQSIEIARELGKSYPLVAFDSFGYADSKARLGGVAEYLTDLEDFLVKADVVFIGNPEEDLLRLSDLIHGKNVSMIIDPWGMFSSADFTDGLQYVPLGRRDI